jgi:hypothetical protein
MSCRRNQEIELTRERFPDLSHGEHFDWILIPDFPLPLGRFNQESTRFLVKIPVGYPNTGPDNFFVDRTIKLANGGIPPGCNLNNNSSSGPAPLPGGWAWFSWHPKSWRPMATITEGDNLITFIRSAVACLNGAEKT